MRLSKVLSLVLVVFLFSCAKESDESWKESYPNFDKLGLVQIVVNDVALSVMSNGFFFYTNEKNNISVQSLSNKVKVATAEYCCIIKKEVKARVEVKCKYEDTLIEIKTREVSGNKALDVMVWRLDCEERVTYTFVFMSVV